MNPCSITVRAIENTPTAAGDAPILSVKIDKAGELKPRENDGTAQYRNPDLPGSKYEDYPDDEAGIDVNTLGLATDAAREIREGGTSLFKAGKVSEALDQYESTGSISLPFMYSVFVLLMYVFYKSHCGIWMSILFCPPRRAMKPNLLTMRNSHRFC